jgi:hypothetical protein
MLHHPEDDYRVQGENNRPPIRWLQGLATGQWFSLGTLVFSTNKNDCHDITEILLKVALNTINQKVVITLYAD